MTKEEFKIRWESDEHGGGITNNDCADCAKEWGLYSNPFSASLPHVVYSVLKHAGCEDAEDYAPF